MTHTVAPELLSTREAARTLGVHVDTVRHLAEAGVLPAVRWTATSRLRFRRADVERLLEPKGTS